MTKPHSTSSVRAKLLIIVGPTASGKSALGVHLAQRFDGEVISADSRQVYRGLNIGTGKITKREMRGIPHHLLDVSSPKKKFSASDFQIHTTNAIAEVVCRGHLPIVVGGTGYYVDALVGGVAVPEVPPNPTLRAKLEKKTAEQLYILLQKKDPARAKTMASPSERNNSRRLIRAIEIATAIGKVPKDHKKSLFNALWIGINPPFAELEQKIEKRLLARIKNGMIAEVQRLRKQGLSFKRMEELGLEYRSLARFLKKEITKAEMTEELRRDIRRYAKKQLAYWKRSKDITWFKPNDTTKIEKAVSKWLKN